MESAGPDAPEEELRASRARRRMRHRRLALEAPRAGADDCGGGGAGAGDGEGEEDPMGRVCDSICFPLGSPIQRTELVVYSSQPRVLLHHYMVQANQLIGSAIQHIGTWSNTIKQEVSHTLYQNRPVI